MKEVSWRRQLPHIRQPNNGPFTTFSNAARALLENFSLLNGKNGGCHLLLGVNIGIIDSSNLQNY
jgi:hypothetical protein